MFNHLPLIDFDELSFEDGENSVTIIFISSFNLSRFSKKNDIEIHEFHQLSNANGLSSIRAPVNYYLYLVS